MILSVERLTTDSLDHGRYISPYNHIVLLGAFQSILERE